MFICKKSFEKQIRQIKSNLWENNQKHDARYHTQKEWENAPKNVLHGYVLGDAGNGENIHTNGGCNLSHFHGKNGDDPEPDRVKTQSGNGRKDGG